MNSSAENAIRRRIILLVINKTCLLAILIAFGTTASAVSAQTTVTAQHAAVEVIPFHTADVTTLNARKASYTFTVTSKDWLATNVTLVPGDQVTFSATGTVVLSDGRSVTPDGGSRGWKDMMRTFPDNAANVGALIGRIGNEDATVPFALGTTKELTVAASGDLYLRINTGSDLTTNGTYSVAMKLAKQAVAVSAATTPDLTKIITPKVFDSIPRRVQDQAGNPGDMVNFAILGNQDQVQKAFTAAGWVAVDKTDKAAVVSGLLATLQHQEYTAVPMSTLFLFGRPQDLSFERAAPFAVAAVRHHLRVWKTAQMVDGKQLWVGSATHDDGFEKDQRNGGITHHVDPKIDVERDFIEQSFADAGVLTAAAYVTPGNPFLSAKTATGGAIESDGRIVMLALR